MRKLKQIYLHIMISHLRISKKINSFPIENAANMMATIWVELSLMVFIIIEILCFSQATESKWHEFLVNHKYLFIAILMTYGFFFRWIHLKLYNNREFLKRARKETKNFGILSYVLSILIIPILIIVITLIGIYFSH